jgi:hypothetical protein
VHRRDSFYRVTGLNAGEVYTLTLSDATDRVEARYMGLGQDLAVPYPDCQVTGSGPTLTCAGHAASDGSLEIMVDGNRTVDGAGYTLDVTPGGIPNEGFWTSYLDITTDLPHSGSVHFGSSWYKVTGLETDRAYTVSLTGLSQDVELWVYALEQLQSHLCNSSTSGLTDEACDATPPNGELYIDVRYFGAPSGATFNLDVQEKPPTDGG